MGHRRRERCALLAGCGFEEPVCDEQGQVSLVDWLTKAIISQVLQQPRSELRVCRVASQCRVDSNWGHRPFSRVALIDKLNDCERGRSHVDELLT